MIPANLVGLKAFTFGQTKTWTAIGANTAGQQTVLNLNGLRPGDQVLVSKPTDQTGLTYRSLTSVRFANVLPIQFINSTVGSITPTANETWTGIIIRTESELTENPII